MNSSMVVVQAEKLGLTFGMQGDGQELLAILKATAFKGQATDAQMTALMIVANHYSLNPFTKELYAFPDSRNGIVPVVGVDGWSRIINNHPQFDGMDFEQDEEKCTCIMYRKDRGHPVRVTEYMAECRREGVQPWKTHPRRMLRHKAMIQCARLAFGFVGIYEQDEAERIIEAAPAGAPTQVIKEVDTQLLARLLKRVQDANTIEALDAVWADGVKEINGDKHVHAELKKSCVARKKELLKPDDDGVITDVEAKPVAAATADDPMLSANELMQKIKACTSEDQLHDLIPVLDAAEMPPELTTKVNELFNLRAQELGAAA